MTVTLLYEDTTLFYPIVILHKLSESGSLKIDENQGYGGYGGDGEGVFWCLNFEFFAYFSCLLAIFGRAGHFDPPPV